MRLLGIDYGEKKIGIAISDESAKFAFPLAVLDNNSAKYVLIALKKIIDGKDVVKIIIGKSLDFKGQPNPIMKRVDRFKLFLEENLKVLIEYENEVLTTKQASRKMAKASSLHKRQWLPFAHKIHASAAALILQSYLDKQHNA